MVFDADSNPRPSKRSRSSVACSRCKDRRQKCDNSAPSCSNCVRAGTKCLYKGGEHPAWYVESLEERIRQLEGEFRASSAASSPAEPEPERPASNHDYTAPPTPLTTGPPPPQAVLQAGCAGQPAVPTMLAASLVTHTASAQTALGVGEPGPPRAAVDHLRSTVPTQAAPTAAARALPSAHLANALGFLSLCAAAEPYYVGSSTGFSLANMVQKAMSESFKEVEVGAGPSAGVSVSGIQTPARRAETSESPEDNQDSLRNLPSIDDRPFSCHRPRPITKPATLPADELGDAFLKAYLSKVHAFYPFLDQHRLQSQHTLRHQLNSEPVTREDRSALAKLHLVYGIGSRHLQLAGKGVPFERSLPEAHFIAASQHLSAIFELRTTENIEIMLLLAFYSLHSPSGPGVWHLTGMAVRTSVELGLHRNVRDLAETQPHVDQVRKRLFWSALILERKVAITLGRPFSLSDDDIDAQIPADIDDSLRDRPVILEAIQKAGLQHTAITAHVHLARLQSILASIQSHNNRLTELNPPSTDHLSNTRAALDHWRDQAVPARLPPPEAEAYLLLEFNKALLLLIQPFVTCKHRQAEHLRVCAESAGAICQLSKRIHQKEPAGFLLLELHDVLVAGITLIYCLWLDEPTLDTLTLINDLGACSTVLFLIAERWESAKRYRDAFEALVKAALMYKQRHASRGVQGGSFQSNTPLDVGADGGVLFEANLWENDESSAWRRMLGEITAAQQATVDDTWFWLNDTTLPLNFAVS